MRNLAEYLGLTRRFHFIKTAPSQQGNGGIAKAIKSKQYAIGWPSMIRVRVISAEG
jgi:hypothetical protein